MMSTSPFLSRQTYKLERISDSISVMSLIDVLSMYLNAGYESSSHTIMWATIFLQEHSEFLQRAKVVDETLRVIAFSFTAFREAKTDVEMNGYLIPKGWKVLTWSRDVHKDPESLSGSKKI
ncbi:Ent-kaurenoic acid oxidase 1 [Raphanus sativus]|nr:Ent-kaurenoic acid oxidase 1 [Raphanus sativus]